MFIVNANFILLEIFSLKNILPPIAVMIGLTIITHKTTLFNGILFIAFIQVNWLINVATPIANNNKIFSRILFLVLVSRTCLQLKGNNNNTLNKDFIISEDELIEIDLFKKYITWVKANCFPVLSDDAKVLLQDFYVNTRQEAAHTKGGKPITARDLKALERLTIARAKCENRAEATIEDALEAIEIYSDALNSIGLSVETAGDLSGVKSENERSVISSMEAMIRTNMDVESGTLSSETIENLRIECGMLCYENGINQEGIFDLAYENVKKSL
jgi:DNA replicative helicase MCM subunit Mcm2 (Cdc46/Mcm family)